jgi:hypothetical protein
MSRARLSDCRRDGLLARRLLNISPHPASGFAFAYPVSVPGSRASPSASTAPKSELNQALNAHHLISANACETGPAPLIAYIIADDGAPPTVFDK